MNKLVRGVIAGSLIGAGVGVAMLMMRRKNPMKPEVMSRRTRGTLEAVKDNALRWTSALKSGTESFSRRLARRSS
ncbi:MAG: hypothetical protein K6U80_10090 [Firmicutes bacterium]|nr:hypothetical protein [Bacillota bacterium]